MACKNDLSKALDGACKCLSSSLLCPPEKRLCTKYRGDNSKCELCWRQYLLEKARGE